MKRLFHRSRGPRVILLAITVVLGACTAMTERPSSPDLAGTSWQLVGLPGQAVTPNPTLTLQFDEQRVSGSDGCNRFTGPYLRDGDSLRIGPDLASTRMACPSDREQGAAAYLLALVEARSYRMDAGVPERLELLSADGEVLATLVAQAQTLTGTAWDVTAIHDGRQAVVSLVEGSRVSLVFDAQGRVSGSAGCNRFSAGFEEAEGGVRIGMPMATKMACAEAGVMAQEQAFLRALEGVRHARIEGPLLELRDADGALLVRGRVAAAVD